jgi:hypothetical protein
MQALELPTHSPYSPYSDFQPFIPYPNQSTFPTLNPNMGPIDPSNGYPYSYRSIPYMAHSAYTSNQTSPLMPSSPYAPSTGNLWPNPPLSPAMGYNQSLQGHMGEPYGHARQGYPSTPPPNWGGPQQACPAWGSRLPRNSIPAPVRSGTFNRMSWSGPSKQEEKARERKAYHPQPPANRSDWVMWVGNV